MTELQTTVDCVPGFKAAGVACGLKKQGKRDLALVLSDAPCTAAGIFTANLVKAAPVLLDQATLAANSTGIRAVVINAGNANACTGEQGLADARKMAAETAAEVGVDTGAVLVMSTGVIGYPLPMDTIERGIIDAAVVARADGWMDAAEAITTTDRFIKAASVRVQVGASSYSVAAIAKGAGMIAPNMATMLCVVATDAALSPAVLQSALHTAAQGSFNRIVVDGDMSTNDTVLLLANGVSGVRIEGGAALAGFQQALNAVCAYLAKQIVRDGEGTSRFITLEITGAASEDAARAVAYAIATSPLVKTAFYGGDANWGRVVGAAGRAGVPLAPDRLALWVMAGENGALGGQHGALHMVQDGIATGYSEETATGIFAQDAVSVRLDLGQGEAAFTVWTCDLGHEYVRINGDYRS